MKSIGPVADNGLRMAGPRLARRLLAAFVLAAVPMHVLADSGPTRATEEIGHLLGYLAASQCEFFRNGTWYGPERAARHLRRKYAYYMDRTSAPTADEFVTEFASASSMSGKPYRVRCADQPEQPSGAWFSAELTRYRVSAVGRSAAPAH